MADSVVFHPSRRWLARHASHLVLGLALLLMAGALLMRGLDLGLWGDVLALEYHFTTLGITGGMSWLVNTYWHRHLLGGVWYVPLRVFFPGQALPWWASSLGLHFVAAFAAFLLFDRILNGRWQAVSGAAALIFTTDTLYIFDHFEFGTNCVRNGALLLALLSMIAYFEYVRGDRKRFAWLGISLLLFFVSMMSYEQNQLFFLAYPLLAAFADRDHGWQLDRRWGVQVAEDLFLFPVLVALYVLLLRIVYPVGSGLSLTIDWLLQQVGGALRLLVDPALWLERIAPVLQPDALPVTLLLIALAFVALALVARPPAAGVAERRPDVEPRLLWRAVIFGLALALLTIAGVAPTQWPLGRSARLIYAAGAGTALAGMALLAWAATRLPRRVLPAVLVIPAILVGTGASLGAQEHTARLACHTTRETVKAAIQEAIPAFSGERVPYLLLVSDADPTRDLCLNAQDINYPYMFALMYGLTSRVGDAIYADALYFTVPESQRPAAETQGSEYSGQYLVVEPEGIYSPLRPGVAIDPASLVIVRYDSATQSATVLDRLPDDLVARANVEVRAPIAWVTNREFIAASGRE